MALSLSKTNNVKRTIEVKACVKNLIIQWNRMMLIYAEMK